VKFAPEGNPFIVAALLLAIGGWFAAAQFGGWVMTALAVALSSLTLFILWFFRDPTRKLPSDGTAVVAPGEGRIIDICEIEEPNFLQTTARRISIFLNVFDVHVQRSPVDGVIEHREYRPGTYQAAWLDKASEHNEQASVGITTPYGKILVRQIAGLIARRIVTDAFEGDEIKRGERIGLIRFGSRVELFVPLHWEVTCAVGDRTRVGATTLARLPVRLEP
jgi:phosphatidylserine decarboxylase